MTAHTPSKPVITGGAYCFCADDATCGTSADQSELFRIELGEMQWPTTLPTKALKTAAVST
jgi:hypothetical protein